MKYCFHILLYPLGKEQLNGVKEKFRYDTEKVKTWTVGLSV